MQYSLAREASSKSEGAANMIRFDRISERVAFSESVFDQPVNITFATLRGYYDALCDCFPNGHIQGQALAGAFVDEAEKPCRLIVEGRTLY
jgi:hypothetical protein